MSNLQIIEALCKLVEYQAEIINSLASALEQQRTLSATEAELVSSSERRYSAIIGENEASDI